MGSFLRHGYPQYRTQVLRRAVGIDHLVLRLDGTVFDEPLSDFDEEGGD